MIARVVLSAAFLLPAGQVTATPTCSQGHVELTVTAHLPASTQYVKYTATNVGVYDLGPSTPGGSWTVQVTRRSGRTAESYVLVAAFSALDCGGGAP